MEFGGDEVLVVVVGSFPAGEFKHAVSFNGIFGFYDTKVVDVVGVGTNHFPTWNIGLKILDKRECADGLAIDSFDNQGVADSTADIGCCDYHAVNSCSVPHCSHGVVRVEAVVGRDRPRQCAWRINESGKDDGVAYTDFAWTLKGQIERFDNVEGDVVNQQVILVGDVVVTEGDVDIFPRIAAEVYASK